MAFSDGRGVDAVLITASTKSSDPVHQAAQMSRKRGRIVLVGVTGLELSRADFYEKELTFQVSCSYGPGRYDETYEQKGQDYPFGFVRWTEQRNFEAVLDLMASKRLDVTPLISRRVPLEQAPAVYRSWSTDRSLLGVVLTYPEQASDLRAVVQVKPRNRFLTEIGFYSPSPAEPEVVAGVIGAGNFASLVLAPGAGQDRARVADRRHQQRAGTRPSPRASLALPRPPPTIARCWTTRRSTRSSSPRATTPMPGWWSRRWPPASTSLWRSRWR